MHIILVRSGECRTYRKMANFTTTPLTPLGRHLLIELHNCAPQRLNDAAHLEKVLLEAAQMASTTVLDVHTRQFEPHGVSVMILIAESHLSIHTWPEYGYAAVDVFTCGEPFDEAAVVNHLAAAVEAQHVSVIGIERGMLSTWAKRESATPTRWSTVEALNPAEEPI